MIYDMTTVEGCLEVEDDVHIAYTEDSHAIYCYYQLENTHEQRPCTFLILFISSMSTFQGRGSFINEEKKIPKRWNPLHRNNAHHSASKNAREHGQKMTLPR